MARHALCTLVNQISRLLKRRKSLIESAHTACVINMGIAGSLTTTTTPPPTTFSDLPEGCLSEIICRTSPWDACRAAAITRGFRPAADSDGVWERFLPSDYRDIIARSVSPPIDYVSKKQLYLHLCDSPILVDDGNLVISANFLYELLLWVGLIIWYYKLLVS